ncbi:hypothetical protein [Methylomonas sp. HYX-M1]|uniref:hypothetical protein n=1 Tax=Methylomonas sp. HYX-M1 TaxID=3139307 RepID=UPI00345BAB41
MTAGYFTRGLLLFCVSALHSAWASAPGTLDSSFGDKGKLTTAVGKDYAIANAVLQQENDKLLVAGVSRDESGDDLMLVRVNNDGSLDTTFNKTGKLALDIGPGDDIGNALWVQNDKRVVVAGSSFQGSNDDFVLVRLTPAGAADNSFSGDGVVITPIGSANDGAYALLQQKNGLLVAGGYTETASAGYDFALVRYTAAGELDKSFDSDGIVSSDFAGKDDVAYALVGQADGKLVAAGYSNNGSRDSFALARYNSNGSLDATFGTAGKVVTTFRGNGDRAYALIRQTDGKWVAVGSSGNGNDDDVALARYGGNGQPDTSFGNGGKVVTAVGSGNEAAYAVIQQFDGKLLVAGYTEKGNGNVDFLLVRYNANGSLDSSFGSGGKLTTSFGAGQDKALAAIAQSNGSLVLAGFAESGTKKVAMARYLFDDDDGDGILDDADNCPLTGNPEQENHDSDADGDACDEDDDNDGVNDADDKFPLDPSESKDNDGDGIGDNADTDDDNDGIPDVDDPYPTDPYLLVRADGSKSGDLLGYAVANAGDLDQDGYDDVIIGVPRCDRKLAGKPRAAGNVGCVSVYSGKTAQALSELVWVGAAAGDEFGIAVAGGADFDKDGISDVVVGAHKADTTDSATGKRLKDAGAVLVYSGADGRLLFRIDGEGKGDRFGAALTLLADADGDSYPDLLIGAWRADPADAASGKKLLDAGAAYVYSGRNQALLHKFSGESKGDGFGAAVAGADIDNDGAGDAIVGAYRYDKPVAGKRKKLANAGAAYLFTAAAWQQAFKIEGSHAGDRFAYALAGFADVNGDGNAEFLVGAPGENASIEGSTRVVKHAGSATLYSGASGDAIAKTNDSDPQAEAMFGSALTAMGDIDGDGLSDFAVGAFGYDASKNEVKLSNAGKIALHSGADGKSFFSLSGRNKGDNFGFALAGGGDQNNDGVADLIVGGYKTDPVQTGGEQPVKNAGSVDVVSGDAGKSD